MLWTGDVERWDPKSDLRRLGVDTGSATGRVSTGSRECPNSGIVKVERKV